MNVNDVRDAIATQLRTITGLRATSFVPSKIEPPTAIVSIGAGSYDDTFTGSMTAEFGVLVLVARADDRSAQKRLDDYISPTGTTSVKACIDSTPTLGSTVGTATVLGWGDPAEFEIGGISYVGVEFTVEACD